jgi:hypothetical protein
MSGQSHKSDTMILAVLGIVSAVVVLLLLAGGWLGEGEGEDFWVRTSRSTNVEGTMVCHTLFERLGVSPVRSDEPLLDDTLQTMDVLFLVDPLLRVQRGEQAALSRWVKGGGVLVSSGADLDTLLDTDDIRKYLSDEHEIPHGKRSKHAEAGPTDPTKVPAEAAKLPLARDVSEVDLYEPSILDSRKAEKLFADARGLRIASFRQGAGRVVVLSDSSFLSNGRIGRKDNAILAMNVAAYALSHARGARVAYDEYHYGMGTLKTGWDVMMEMVLRTPPGWAILSVTASGLLYLAYRGRRFGTRRAPGRVRRRSKLEYVQSVGVTYREAGANRLVFRIIFQWFRHRGAQSTGLAASAPSTEIATRLARRARASTQRYAGIFQDCEAALSGPTLSSRRMSTLLGQLAQIESEVFDGHSRSK